jgi:hypothetical protein
VDPSTSPLWRADGSRSPRHCTPNRPYGLQCGTPHLGEVCLMLYPTPRVLTGSVFACFSTCGYTHRADLPLDLRHLCACELVFDVLNQTSRSSSQPIVSWAVGQSPPVTVCLRALCGGMPASGSTLRAPSRRACPVATSDVSTRSSPRDSRFQGLG